MAPGQGRSSDTTKLVTRAHALIVPPDQVKKEPETTIGRVLKQMVQGDEQLLHAVSNTRGHADANRPGDWTGEKMIIGIGTGTDGKVYNLGLGVGNSGGTVPHTMHLPTINKIFEANQQWTASRNRVKFGWKESQADIYDPRVRLAYWEQQVKMSDGTMAPAYKDIGLNKEDAMACYKNWLVRLYGFRYPQALLGPKYARSKQPTIDEGVSPPPRAQKKRGRPSAAHVAQPSQKKTKTTSTRTGVRSESPTTDEDNSITGLEGKRPLRSSARRKTAIGHTSGVFSSDMALVSSGELWSETYHRDNSKPRYTRGQPDSMDEQPFSEGEGDPADVEYDEESSLEHSDYGDGSPPSGLDNDEREVANQFQASLESLSEEGLNSELENEQEDPQEEQYVAGRDSPSKASDDSLAEAAYDELNVNYNLHTDEAWWHAFNEGVRRLSEAALLNVDICVKIGNGYVQTHGEGPGIVPPPRVLQEAYRQANEQSIAYAEDTRMFRLWAAMESELAAGGARRRS